MLRRTLLAVSAVLSAGATFAADKVGIRPETVPSSPEYPRLRAGTQLDHLYEPTASVLKTQNQHLTFQRLWLSQTLSAPGALVFGMQRCRSQTE